MATILDGDFIPQKIKQAPAFGRRAYFHVSLSS
jgi:hypothetical protein